MTKDLLEPGFNLTLRPMEYPQFFEMYQDAIKNTWTVEEIAFDLDLEHLRDKLTPKEMHLINRLVAFFATGDTIVSNNLVLNLYGHINSPEARMYLSRQLFEEALHVQFYLQLLDLYLPDDKEREAAFTAVDNIPSIKHKAEFMYKYMDIPQGSLDTDDKKRQFLMNLICFATTIEGLQFYGAFAYVYFLRDKGLLPGLADGTNWVFRDESMHMNFAFEVIRTIKEESPHLFDAQLEKDVYAMMTEAVNVEYAFSLDVLGEGIPGMSTSDMKTYLEAVADDRLAMLAMAPLYGSHNPFTFMDLQDVQSLSNFFERTVSSYQVIGGSEADVAFDQEF